MTSFKSEYDSDALLYGLGSWRLLNTWPTHWQFLAGIVSSAFQFNKDVPDHERMKIARKVVLAHGNDPTTINKSLILRELSLHQRNYLKQTLEEYEVVTYISLTLPVANASIRSRDFTASIHSNRPKWVKVDPEATTSLASIESLANGHSTLILRIMARSPAGAIEEALRRFDIVRGWWNFIANAAKQFPVWPGPSKNPVNAIQRGPVYYVFKNRTFVATEGSWSDSSAPALKAKSLSKPEWGRLRSLERDIRRLTRRHPYADFIDQGFIRYARGLDHTDHESDCLAMWSLLEFLTGAWEQKMLLERAVFWFAERKVQLNLLRQIQEWRNSLVHQGVGQAHADVILFQIKHYVEELLRLHLNARRFRFESKEALLEFLSSETDPKLVSSKLKRLRRVKKFLKT